MGLLFILSFSAVGAVVSRAAFGSKSSTGWEDYFRAVEDRWTWATLDGRLYEDVEVETIEADEIVLHHRDGVARIAIASLSADSREKLARTSAWHRQSGLTADSSASGHLVASPVAGGLQPA